MQLQNLAQFPKIGWDFDDTLVGATNSTRFHRFIVDNPQIEHYIVTFRTGSLVEYLWGDLLEVTRPASMRGLFKKVINPPHYMWEEWNRDQKLRRATRLIGPHSTAEVDFAEFKAKACVSHGIPVLIDDDIEWTQKGCADHGIVHLHPKDIVT